MVVRNDSIFHWPARIALATTLFAPPAAGQTSLNFDPPKKTVTIPSSTTPPSGDAVTCVFYTDIMIRISGTDTPAPDNARLVPLTANTPLPNCSRSAPSQGIELRSSASGLDGRKGNFLVFQYVDQVGAGYFTIFDARTGHVLFMDGILKGITAVTLDRGILELRYNRGINATCSLLSDRTGCWEKLLARKQIPSGVFPGPPSVETCNKSYLSDPVDQRSPNPDADPSIVSYDAVLTLDSKGHAMVRPVGPLLCDPAP